MRFEEARERVDVVAAVVALVVDAVAGARDADDITAGRDGVLPCRASARAGDGKTGRGGGV